MCNLHIMLSLKEQNFWPFGKLGHWILRSFSLWSYIAFLSHCFLKRDSQILRWKPLRCKLDQKNLVQSFPSSMTGKRQQLLQKFWGICFVRHDKEWSCQVGHVTTVYMDFVNPGATLPSCKNSPSCAKANFKTHIYILVCIFMERFFYSSHGC